MLCLHLQNGHPYFKDKLWPKRASFFSVKDSVTSSSLTGRLNHIMNPWFKRKGEREEVEKRGDGREMKQLRENLCVTYTVKWTPVLYRLGILSPEGKGEDRQRRLNGVIWDNDLSIRNWKWELSCCRECVIFRAKNHL